MPVQGIPQDIAGLGEQHLSQGNKGLAHCPLGCHCMLAMHNAVDLAKTALPIAEVSLQDKPQEIWISIGSDMPCRRSFYGYNG